MDVIGEPLVFMFFTALGLLAFFGWVWGFGHLFTNRHLVTGDKVIFATFMLLLGPIGTLVYLANISGRGRPKHTTTYYRLHPHHKDSYLFKHLHPPHHGHPV